MNRITRFSPVPGIAAAGLLAILAAASTDVRGAAPTGIRIDGSSTVFPITEAVAEEFLATNPDVRVTVGVSGTGGGFKKFTAGETDINNASRPITRKEIDAALTGGVAFIELPIAFDGLSVVVNPANTWCKDITVAELKKIWEPTSKVKLWSDARAGWPSEEIRLYGPGADSGTFDYFTEAINGKAKACRPDFTGSEDDNVLAQGIAGDRLALGYFGFAYYAANSSRLKLVAVDGGKGPVIPSDQTIRDGSYSPLSRPLFIYVRKPKRAELRAFVDFYLAEGPALATEVGYVPLPDSVYGSARRRWAALTIGSAYAAESSIGKSVEQLFN